MEPEEDLVFRLPGAQAVKTAPQALIDLLNSGQQFMMADLYTFTLVSGTILRYTSWDADQVYYGQTFSASGPLIERSRVRTVIGVEVDTLDLTLWPDPTHLVGSQPWLAAAASGALDGALVSLYRVFMDAAGAIVGGYINFSGRWSDFTMTRTEIRAAVRSDLELFNVKIPRNLYQAGCLHTLYDADCGVNRAGHAVGATVSSATRTTLSCALAQAAGWFDLGYIRFDSGALAGTKRSVKSYTPGSFVLLNPLPMVPSAGDAFTAYPGCDKTLATCKAKFDNLIAFRGFPFIPQPETAR